LTKRKKSIIISYYGEKKRIWAGTGLSESRRQIWSPKRFSAKDKAPGKGARQKTKGIDS
jgi:hypothetical protein